MSGTMDGPAFTHSVRVRFAETDAQGIAHHASFVVWLEEARVAYLAAFAGGYRAIRDRGIEALTTGVHLEYGRAAVFDDVLTIGVRCAEIRGARFRYEYVVERDGERVAHGWTAHATVDAATHRPTRVPDWFVEDDPQGRGVGASADVVADSVGFAAPPAAAAPSVTVCFAGFAGFSAFGRGFVPSRTTVGSPT